jgi:hypothetical protein
MQAQRWNTFLAVVFGFALWGGLGSGQTRAGIIVSNFGPSDQYSSALGWNLETVAQVQAQAFKPTTTEMFTQALIALSTRGGPNEISVELRNDIGGKPGTVLESITFTNQLGPFGSPNPPLLWNSTLHPLLNAGQQYWLDARSPLSGSLGIWNDNDTGDTSLTAFSNNGGATWSTSKVNRGAFEVDGSAAAVPEPSGLIMVGICAIGMVGWGWRHQRFRIPA